MTKVWIDGEELPQAAIEFELARLVRFYREHAPPESVESQMDVLRRRAVDQAIGAKLLRKTLNSACARWPRTPEVKKRWDVRCSARI